MHNLKKIICFMVGFLCLYLLIQQFMIPKYRGGSTDYVDGFYALDDNSLNVLFLGASQMYCTVDSQRLTDEYGINSYDFGAGSQQLTTTSYYLQEALKTQSPSLVMVEICNIVRPNSEMTDGTLPWSYAPTKCSKEKYESLKTLLGDDKSAFGYCYFPLLMYHNTSINKNNFAYYIIRSDYSKRGSVQWDTTESIEILYYSEDEGEEWEIPDENIDAIKNIWELCRTNDIDCIFFKAPTGYWTRTDSRITKNFMSDNGFDYFDMNDFISDIKLDTNTDFYDQRHLNWSGSQKSTDYLAVYIECNYDL